MKYGMGDRRGEVMTQAEHLHNLGILYDFITTVQLGLMPTDEQAEEAQEALGNLYTEEDIAEIGRQMDAAGLGEYEEEN